MTSGMNIPQALTIGENALFFRGGSQNSRVDPERETAGGAKTKGA
jgi:hypothetical protein